MDGKRSIRLIGFFLVGLFIAYALGSLFNPSQTNTAARNVIGYVLAPVITAATVLVYNLWRERRQL